MYVYFEMLVILLRFACNSQTYMNHVRVIINDTDISIQFCLYVSHLKRNATTMSCYVRKCVYTVLVKVLQA